MGKLEDGTPVYLTECGISPPRVIYQEEPEYTEKARKKNINGTVELSAVVDSTGNVRDVKVEHSLERSMDQSAISAVSKWRFEPGTKDGKPIAVKLNVEVDFRLYGGAKHR